MRRRTRRGLLAATGGLLAGLGGCGGTTSSPTSTPTPTPTPAPATLRLEPTPVADLASDARVVVYPTTLRGWLREAATTDATLRVHATARVPMPRPPLPAFERIRLTDPSGDVDGRYAVRATGGTRYRHLAGGSEVDPPANATVTDATDLDPERRAFVLDATTDAGGFYPETELGEWARREFFGGYVRRNGTVYRGHEVRQTDAAFSSRECWYVLALDPGDGSAAPTLDLAGLDDAVRSTVDGLLDARGPQESVTRDAAAVPRSVRRFVAETDYLLTHAALLRSRLDRADG